MDRPPRLASWLLRLCLKANHASVLGDLEEEFYDHAAYLGPRRAALIYCGQTLTTLPALLLVDLFWSTLMLRNYFKITLRTLFKYKGFSTINILGLAASLSVCLLVILFVRDQTSFDAFHDKADRIYRVTTDETFVFGQSSLATSPGPLGPVLREDYPFVEEVVRLRQAGGLATYAGTTVPLDGLYAEASFFQLFDFSLAAGDPGTVLRDPYSIVLTPEAALKLFGDEDPIGKVITRESLGDFTVTGLLEATDGKTHLHFEMLASFATLVARKGQSETGYDLDNWDRSTVYYTYVLLEAGHSPSALEEALAPLADYQGATEAEGPRAFHVQDLQDINLGLDLSNEIGSTASSGDVLFPLALALIIMLTACFNYINLSIARSLKRAKEVGIRKVAGAQRGQLIKQFLSETVFIALVSTAAAAVLLVWLVPGFNSLGFVQELNASLSLKAIFQDPWTYAYFLGFSLLIGVLAGLYPALHLSAFRPATVLKGLSKIRGFSGLTLRKTLIVSQFTLSLLFIIMTSVFLQQFEHLLTADYGFDRDHLLSVRLQGVAHDTFRQEMMNHAAVVNVAAASDLPVAGSQTQNLVRTSVMEDPVLIQAYGVDEHYHDLMGLDLVAGRSFSEAFATDQTSALLLNETAVGMLGLGTPAEAVGQTVWFEGEDMTIIGVAEDFYTRSSGPISPLAFHAWPARFRLALVRFNPDDLPGLLAHLEATWEQFDQAPPLDYRFFEEQLEARFADLQDVIQALGLIAAIAIFIACLGLLGMATYSIETRLKEVGMRKVLGADVVSLVVLLSKDFLKMIALAVGIAAPLAWVLSAAWLSDFASRIPLPVGLFTLSIGALLALALLTIGSQTVKAALTNPVDTLRHE